jgi:hypothetical protein
VHVLDLSRRQRVPARPALIAPSMTKSDSTSNPASMSLLPQGCPAKDAEMTARRQFGNQLRVRAN